MHLIRLLSLCSFLSMTAVMAVMFSAHLNGADEGPVHTLRLSGDSHNIALVFNGGKAQSVADFIESMKDGGLITPNDVVRVISADFDGSDLKDEPVYSQTGLIHALRSRGAKLQYVDGKGATMTYFEIAWTNYDGRKGDPDDALFTLNGKPIDLDMIYLRLSERQSVRGDCLQIILPWNARASGAYTVPFDRQKLFDIAEQKEMRVESLYDGF